MNADRKSPWVIVGGGLAAAKAATTLRKEGFDGSLVVVAAERHEPYERPALSKDYLRGETPAEKLQAAEPSFWTSADTELITGLRATNLDLEQRRVRLGDGSWRPFGKLLLATGSSAIRPDIPGASADFVHILRTVEDADSLRSAAASAGSVVVAGGGWIAAEVAASLRQMGRDVTLVIPGHEILEKHLGPEVGAIYSGLHADKGVKIVRGARVVEIVDGHFGRGVRLSGGELIPADLVVLGFGATPNVDLARTAGLAVASGIVADQELHASTPDVFVAGDVASAWHPRYDRHVRVEHWDNARQQGRVAALNMLDRPTTYDRLPYFYSDQYELSMEAFGLPGDAGEVAIRQTTGNDRFVALWISGGRAIAGMHGNAGDDAKVLQKIVRDLAEVDRRRFLDTGTSLADLLPAEQPA